MTSGSSEPTVRSLVAEDAPELSTFPCRQYLAPWTTVVEELIQERLASQLAADPDLFAAGCWTGDVLCGVAVWRFENDRGTVVCRSIVVAVRLGYVRRGVGGRLKRHVIDQARLHGAKAVISEVHWDNEPMLALNISAGANVYRQPGDWDYSLCVIPLQ